jgi:hypothetical protein
MSPLATVSPLPPTTLSPTPPPPSKPSALRRSARIAAPVRPSSSQQSPSSLISQGEPKTGITEAGGTEGTQTIAEAAGSVPSAQPFPSSTSSDFQSNGKSLKRTRASITVQRTAISISCCMDEGGRFIALQKAIRGKRAQGSMPSCQAKRHFMSTKLSAPPDIFLHRPKRPPIAMLRATVGTQMTGYIAMDPRYSQESSGNNRIPSDIVKNNYYLGHEANKSFRNGLENMEQPTYQILKSGDMTVLPPGQLHAVLSPVNAAVGGWTCYKEEWRGYIDMLLRLGKESRKIEVLDNPVCCIRVRAALHEVSVSWTFVGSHHNTLSRQISSITN